MDRISTRCKIQHLGMRKDREEGQEEQEVKGDNSFRLASVCMLKAGPTQPALRAKADSHSLSYR